MKKPRPGNVDRQKVLKAFAKVAREKRLESWKMIGQPRSSSWGGKPTAKQERKQRNKGLDF